MNTWNQLADDKTIAITVAGLGANGMHATVVARGGEAKDAVLRLIPAGASVFTMTSVTLDTIGLASAINDSSTYISVRKQLLALDRNTQGRQMRQLSAAPEWAVGSVHAVTQDGHVLLASQGGSQLPAYVYGADHVIWVVGAQKIVKDTNEGIRRIYEYCLPLESERARKAYGAAGSAVNKLLVINKEVKQGRISIILVKEVLGF